MVLIIFVGFVSKEETDLSTIQTTLADGWLQVVRCGNERDRHLSEGALYNMC